MDQIFLLHVLLLNLFFLCQLGSAMQSRSGASSTNSAVLPYNQNPYNRKLPYSSSSHCDTDDGLPCPETDALRTVISSLGLSSAPSISRSFCNESKSLNSITINCTCSGSVCHVTEIIMENMGLRGVIHEDVGKLTYLKTLDLSNNKIHDSIPYEIGNLTNLTILDLSNNQLSGRIPNSLGHLNNLQTLSLKLNLLSGEIPQSLGKLSSLVYLSFRGNKLSGEIPHELGNLSQLEELRLDDNELSGELPSELGKLSNLEEFWVTSNNLTGKLPKEYDNLRNLLSFEVGGNYLSGPIDPFIANWTNLTSLNLMGNDFDGGLPEEIFNMTSLEYLWVSDLKEPGLSFPKSANLTNLYQLILRNCSIKGRIPEYISNWSWLLTLDLSFNQLTGEIPDSFHNLILSKMFLTENKLSGKIPGWINKVVYKGDLSYNNFTFPEPGKEHMYPSYNNSKNVSRPTPQKINVEPKNRTFLYQIMDERCHHKKSKFHSFFINAGGDKTATETGHYDADTNTSLFYVSPNNWAYSCSGYFQSSSSDASDYIKNTTWGAPSIEETARLCPQALTYYGFCLKNGKYKVKLHFAEIVYAKDEDHSSLGKRVFDIYIQNSSLQGNREKKDFNIKQKAGGPKKIWTENFTAHVEDHLLEIRLFWAGKGSTYNPPFLNGPLISAITVIPDFPFGGLSHAQIAGIAAASLFIPLLLLAFMWRMGWLSVSHLATIMVDDRVPSSTQGSKNKLGFVNSTIKAPSEEADPEDYATWSRCNDMVHSWIVNPLNPEIADSVIYYSTAHEQDQQKLKQFLMGLNESYNAIRGQILLMNPLPSIRQAYAYAELPDQTVAVKRLFLQSNQAIDQIGREVYTLKTVKHQNLLEFLDVYLKKDLHMLIYEYTEHGSLAHALFVKISDFGLAKLSEEESPNVVIGVGDTFYKTFDRNQALDILNLAILCINPSPTLRPTMSEVVSVLEGNKKIEELFIAATPST
ncbi:hypothetical protein JRO89_XS04G0284500 [Xanthoceras sorbifolium]|uniref:non-specific serine/threonine protein kinase n=1 Tax=Xanthoceras sorbifolium TaxID=99658 RepID=A0ABQ8I883_9ROSI|nr:hypothetical protein JRO89_XS04G0284500 [Xanthoceras sorbifolium]